MDGPGERIPLDAIRYWEDTLDPAAPPFGDASARGQAASLAAQGPVIDGLGNLRIDDKQRVLLDILPSDGSGAITLEVGGTPVIATGFSPEHVPGGSRKDIFQLIGFVERDLKRRATMAR